jgi:hypothetical protein
MVQHLLAALSASTVIDDSGDNDSPSMEHSILVRIGRAIKLPSVVTPIQSARRQHLFFDDTTTTSTPVIAPSSPERRSLPSRVFGGIRSSIVTLMSPQRRKNNPSLVGDANRNMATTTASSPRNGSDSKRARVSEVCAVSSITNNPLWGICTMEEFVQFSVGDQFVIILPSVHKNDHKHATSVRKAVRERIVTAVSCVLVDTSNSSKYKAPHRRSSDSEQKRQAHDHLNRFYGIQRNKKIYLELRCGIHSYPHRDDFINNTMSAKDIERLFSQNEGIYLSLLDYKEQIVHIRWSELIFIQLWQPYYRDDHRPPTT